MNLCFVCSEYPPFRHGGIGSAVQTLGRTMAARGHHVRVVGVYPAGTSYETEDRLEKTHHGVSVYRLPAASPGRLSWSVDRRHVYRTIAAWAHRGEIDFVEVPDWEGLAAGWPGLGIPVVVRLHGSITYFGHETNQKVSKAARLIESNSFHRTDFCSSSSRYAASVTEKLFGKHASPPAILYNFVDVPLAVSIQPRSRTRVVFAGSLVAKKGVVPLIRAWNDVARVRPDAELHLLGKDAPFEGGASMQDHLTSLLHPEVRGTVTFHGHVSRDKVVEAFRTCRMAVFPSFSEAFSLVPLEAMAEGCPVIYSKRHSGPEVITHDHDGLLAEPSAPPEIAAAVLRLLNDNELAGRISDKGVHTVRERFSTQALAGKYENFYESCIRTYRKSAPQIRALMRMRFTAHA